MENAIFRNNPSNSSSYTYIENKPSDVWVRDKLKELYGSHSLHETKPHKPPPSDIPKQDTYEDCNSAHEPCCHVKLDSILRLKDSTKQLLCILEEIQSKVHTKDIIKDETPKFKHIFQSGFQPNNLNTIKSVIDCSVLQKLEDHTRNLDAIYIQDEQDDCSVYKRLIRKCHCLNHPDYNDFIIHFNEDSRFTTSNLGEIIKNLRILRKFLYMGGSYTKNALMFLYEGLLESQHNEKTEIIQGCAHADICNVFDEHSIVICCISWPCKYKYYGNYVTQNLASGFLYKLAEIEQGRRYLNYNSKISNDIRKVLRKKSSLLEVDIIDSLNATLNLLKPTFSNNLTVTCFTKSIYEGMGPRIIKDLFQHRQLLTYEEICMHLDLLKSCSAFENGTELTLHLPALLILFKQLLMEYDNSELNIIVTNILNNIVAKNSARDAKSKTLTALTFVDTATEAIPMKNQMCQKPSKKNCKRICKPNKSGLGISPNKYRQPSKQKALGGSVLINRSRKFTRGNYKTSMNCYVASSLQLLFMEQSKAIQYICQQYSPDESHYYYQYQSQI